MTNTKWSQNVAALLSVVAATWATHWVFVGSTLDYQAFVFLIWRLIKSGSCCDEPWCITSRTQRRFAKTHSHGGGKPQKSRELPSTPDIFLHASPGIHCVSTIGCGKWMQLALHIMIYNIYQYFCLYGNYITVCSKVHHLDGSWLIPTCFFVPKYLEVTGHSIPKSLFNNNHVSSHLLASWPEAGAWGRCTSACQSRWRKN